MATFDMSATAVRFSMTTADLVNHASQVLSSSGIYRWNGGLGSVTVTSFFNDISAPSLGVATAGTVNAARVALGSGDVIFTVSGLSASLVAMVTSEVGFWRAVLAGATTLIMPEDATVELDFISGDFATMATGESRAGGNGTWISCPRDVAFFFQGDAVTLTVGDALYVSGNQLIGGAYRIKSGAGADKLYGEVAQLFSGTVMAFGGDTLDGGAGSDVLNGGGGSDSMEGADGSDVFHYLVVTDSGTTAATRDVVTGFKHLSDSIDLSAIDANAGIGGNNSFTFIGGAGFSAEGQVRVRQSGGDTFFDINTTGTAGADMSIKLAGLITLTAADFIL